jgi:hypothetical protein
LNLSLHITSPNPEVGRPLVLEKYVSRVGFWMIPINKYITKHNIHLILSLGVHCLIRDLKVKSPLLEFINCSVFWFVSTILFTLCWKITKTQTQYLAPLLLSFEVNNDQKIIHDLHDCSCPPK